MQKTWKNNVDFGVGTIFDPESWCFGCWICGGHLSTSCYCVKTVRGLNHPETMLWTAVGRDCLAVANGQVTGFHTL